MLCKSIANWPCAASGGTALKQAFHRSVKKRPAAILPIDFFVFHCPLDGAKFTFSILFLFFLAEDAAGGGLHAIGLACGLAELAQKLLLLGVQVLGGDDVNGDVLVAAGRTV